MIHRNFIEYYKYRRSSGKKGWPLVRILVHDILAEFIGSFFEILCRINVFTPKIFVQMDGGICSQMHQYLVGQIYAEQGLDVRYDLSFFRINGMDVDGKFPRFFEIEDMFPNLHVKTAGKVAMWFYRFFLRFSSYRHELPKKAGSELAPIYLGSYYILDDELFKNLFDKHFRQTKLADIKSHPTIDNHTGCHKCAVHVRRGDLARGDNPWYGGVTDDYFFRAIEYVSKRHSEVTFYFFSDEMDYVETNLLHKLDVEYELVKGPHKAYEDLILISKCDTIIASQGSFGKFAAMLNEKSLLILQDDCYATPWLARKPKAIAI